MNFLFLKFYFSRVESDFRVKLPLPGKGELIAYHDGNSNFVIVHFILDFIIIILTSISIDEVKVFFASWIILPAWIIHVIPIFMRFSVVNQAKSWTLTSFVFNTDA